MASHLARATMQIYARAHRLQVRSLRLAHLEPERGLLDTGNLSPTMRTPSGCIIRVGTQDS